MADLDLQPFWRGVERGELLAQRCLACGRRVFYPRAVCPACGAPRLAWEATSGSGQVHAYTIVHRAPPGFEDDTPYAVGLVVVDDDVRLVARLVDCDPQAVRVGMRVRLAPRALAEGTIAPCFAPTEVA
jgi:uncharacterized OB-fold protein